MKLIEMTSLLYKKRLIRELNSSPDGFYASVATFNLRCSAARINHGVLECYSPVGEPKWFTPSHETFSDPYSRIIVASRRA